LVLAFATESMTFFTETSPAVFAFETASFELVLETEPEGCSITSEPNVC
jgi:hypothetical protein